MVNSVSELGDGPLSQDEFECFFPGCFVNVHGCNGKIGQGGVNGHGQFQLFCQKGKYFCHGFVAKEVSGRIGYGVCEIDGAFSGERGFEPIVCGRDFVGGSFWVLGGMNQNVIIC